MSELTITAIHILAIRGVGLVTGKLRSGKLTSGDELRRIDGAVVSVLGIEFPTPRQHEDEVTLVTSINVAESLRFGDILISP
jgi:hypothetical protein